MSQKIRIGNDIGIQWSLLDAQEQPYVVEGRDVAIELNVGNHRVKITDFSLSGNVISFTYYGKDQRLTGSYALKYIENGGKVDMVTFDTRDAFTLVEHSWLALDEGETPETIQLEIVSVESEIISTSLRGAVRYDIDQNLTSEEKARARANIGVTGGGGVVHLKAYFAYSEEEDAMVYDHGDVTSTDQIMGLVAAGKLPVLDVYTMEEGEPEPADVYMSLPYAGAFNNGVGGAGEDWAVEFQFAYDFGYAYKVYFVTEDGALKGYFANEMASSEAFVTDIIEGMECSDQDIDNLFNE